MLAVNAWRRRRRDVPLSGYQELCRELAASGPGTFAELDSTGARSVLRRFSDAWFAAAKRRKDGDLSARFPRRRRGLVPVRWYHGTFTLDGRRLRIPTAKGTSRLWVRLAREVPYPVEQVRSVTLLCEGGRLFLDVTAEVPVAVYPPGGQPDPGRVAGVDLGIIHPYAVAGPDGERLLVSGRAIRAEHRMHLADTKAVAVPWHGGRRNVVSGVAAVAAVPPPGTPGGGPAPAAGPSGPTRSRPHRRLVGGGAAGRCAARRGSTRGARHCGGAAAPPAVAAVADRPAPASSHRQGHPRRHQCSAGRRTRHVVDLSGLQKAGAEASWADLVLSALRVLRAP
ncbi:hypothetical protein OG799_15010 [Micromonospora sp. NBC_00898]|uniref:hypothetical protein n=1 Tax=Micromonospora sp. NBC_00898 TaxID=2975981 RepID=UPI0038698FC2|nr:hypothetical protein OG799_15010 [Micromonospora sp. NBC_00898]